MNFCVIVVALLILLCCLEAGMGAKVRAKNKGRSKTRGKKRQRGKSSKSDGSKTYARALQNSFVLQSTDDKWQCFAGGELRRCGIDTLWYQTGSGYSTDLHHRVTTDVTIPSELCLVRKSCEEGSDDASRVSEGNCSQSCSSAKWSIEKESNNGFSVIVYNGTQLCVSMNLTSNEFYMDSCVGKYATFIKYNILKNDLAVMNSPLQTMIDAVLNGENSRVLEYFAGGNMEVNARNWEDATILHAAASKGDMRLLDYLVKTLHADVNLYDKSHRNPLMEAAIHGHLDAVKLLISFGAEADSADSLGVTALMMASEKGENSVVEFLLEQPSVDVNRPDLGGWCALHRACQSKVSTGIINTITALLAGGGHVNAASNEGRTPISIASEVATEKVGTRDDLSVIKMLLEHNADINIKTFDPPPLLHASWTGHDELVELFLSHNAEVNLTIPPTNVSALMYAAASGSEKIVKMLLEHGADVNKRHNSGGGTALSEAAINGSLAVVKLLIDASSDVMVSDDENITCLHAAAEGGHVQVSELLLNLGVPIDAVAVSGTTPLMHAAYNNKSDVVRLLLDKKANVNIATNATEKYIEKNRLEVQAGTGSAEQPAELYEHHVSALMMACKQGFLPIVKMLVEAGAQINQADASMKTPIAHAASSNNSVEVITYLVENGGDPNTILWDKYQSILLFAVVNKYTDLGLLLLKRGANATFVDEEGNSVATWAAFEGNQAIMDELISRSTGLSSENSQGTNPLIVASAEGHREIVSALLQSKMVDIHSKDVDGTNALMAASVSGQKDVVNLLIKAGADVNVRNSEGHTALMFAYNGKHQVEHLIEKYREYMKIGEDNSTKMLREALNDHINLIQLLKKSGADSAMTDNYGHIASDFDRVEFVEDGIEEGTKVNSEL